MLTLNIALETNKSIFVLNLILKHSHDHVLSVTYMLKYLHICSFLCQENIQPVGHDPWGESNDPLIRVA